MKEFIIFTVVGGFSYVVCYNDTQKFFVKASDSAYDVFTTTDEDYAKELAGKISDNVTTYNHKELEK